MRRMTTIRSRRSVRKVTAQRRGEGVEQRNTMVIGTGI
jgi:hypothetical protein